MDLTSMLRLNARVEDEVWGIFTVKLSSKSCSCHSGWWKRLGDRILTVKLLSPNQRGQGAGIGFNGVQRGADGVEDGVWGNFTV